MIGRLPQHNRQQLFMKIKTKAHYSYVMGSEKTRRVTRVYIYVRTCWEKTKDHENKMSCSVDIWADIMCRTQAPRDTNVIAGGLLEPAESGIYRWKHVWMTLRGRYVVKSCKRVAARQTP